MRKQKSRRGPVKPKPKRSTKSAAAGIPLSDLPVLPPDHASTNSPFFTLKRYGGRTDQPAAVLFALYDKGDKRATLGDAYKLFDEACARLERGDIGAYQRTLRAATGIWFGARANLRVGKTRGNIKGPRHPLHDYQPAIDAVKKLRLTRPLPEYLIRLCRDVREKGGYRFSAKHLWRECKKAGIS